MKYYLQLLLLILITFGCNNDPKQPETVAVDPTTIKKTPPPFQVVAEEPKPQIQARALRAVSATPDSSRITKNGDTILYFSETQTGTGTTTYSYTYKVPRVEVRYKGSVVVPPVDPPVPPTTGKYLSLPVSAKISYSGRSNFTIENLRFENVSGAAITLTNCTNVTIRNCFFNKATDEGISAEKCTGVVVENNLFNGVASGVYALSSSNLTIRNNQSVNPHVRPQGGRGNLVQFNGVGGAGNIIESNSSVAFPGENNIEDHISLFNTSNVTVRNNKLVGGGTSTSGSGIMTGDNGGSNQLIENNIIYNTGNAGIGIAGGSNIRVTGNKIYGERTAVSNNPLYMWSQAGAACSGNTITGNRVKWVDKNGSLNGGWNAQNCSNSTYVPATDPTLTFSALGLPSDWNQIINFITPAEVLKIRGK